METVAEYEREGPWLYHAYPLMSGGALKLQAKDVRRGRWGTGIHALVGIAVNGQAVSYSNANVERDEERGKLVRSALKAMGEIHREEFNEQRLKSCLDAFCYGLWDATVAQFSGELMEGDPDSGPPKPILGQLLIDQGGTIIHAPPGRGKSYVLMTMGVCLDAGVETLWPCEQRRTGYINLERSAASMHHRLARVNLALGLDGRRPLPFLNARGKSLMDILDGVHRFIETYELEVIVLDSISRAGFGSLVADDVANSVIDTLNGFGITWGGLAHSPRGDDSHVFGSVFFEAGEDIGVRLLSQLTNDGMTLGIGLRVDKANDLKTGSLSLIALDFDEQSGLVAIRPATGNEFPEIVAQRKMSLPDAIAGYLLSVGKDDATAIADATGLARTAVSRELNKNQRFVGAGKDGRRVLYAVRQQQP